MGEVFLFAGAWLCGILIVIWLLYFVSRHNLWFRKYSLSLFLVFLVFGFTLYFFGYQYGGDIPAEENSVLRAVGDTFLALFCSGRMLSMELDIAEAGALSDNDVYRAVYGIVVFITMVLLATTIVTNVGGGILGRIRFLFLRTFGSRQNVYFLYGISREAVCLAEDIRRRDPGSSVLLLGTREDAASSDDSARQLENDAFRRGAYKILFSPDHEPAFLYRILKKCRKRVYLICMNPSFEKNIFLLQKAVRLCGSGDLSRLQLYAVYEREKSRMLADAPPFCDRDIHWIDPSELAVRQLLLLPEFSDLLSGKRLHSGAASGELRLALIGFSKTAEVLWEYLSSCVQTSGLSATFYLFGEEIEKRAAWFLKSNPGLSALVSFVTVDAEPESPDFYDFFADPAMKPDGLFFLDDESSQNVRLALRLKELLRSQGRDVPFYLLGHSVWGDRLALDACRITCFGLTERIYSYDIFIEETLDSLAKAVHRYYSDFHHSDEDADALWAKAGFYEKMSSRALALHFPWKARCAGFRIVPDAPEAASGSGASGASARGGQAEDHSAYGRALAEDPLLLKNLAIGEHRRWAAYLFSMGWQSISPEELPPGQSRDSARKRHACLVDWEELPKADARCCTNFQELDIHLIRSFEKILHFAGYHLERREKSE